MNSMKKSFAGLMLVVGMILAVPRQGDAENRTITWVAVTTYTDGTPIEPTKTVRYDIFWTADAGLSSASLKTVASPVSGTSATFDPDALGMPRGQTVYFTGDAVLSTGEKSSLSSAYPWNVPVSTTPVPATLSSLSISGLSSVNEGSSGTYTATATWSDNTTTAVTPTWSENSSYASISAGGVLTATAVTSNQTATVTASYTSGGVTRTATRSVTIVNVPAGTLLSPQNLVIAGPVATSPAILFRVSWDPATTYADGTPIPTGSVRYTIYWTTDPSLSAGSLKTLAYQTAGTSVDFDPAAAGMSTDQRVYLTAVVTTTLGEQSPLSAGLSWVALNPGPAAPTGGTINRR